jgi:osmotically-inducible protein OsmY
MKARDVMVSPVITVNRIIQAMEKQEWCPFGLSVIVRDGIVHLSGILTDAQGRQAAIVAAENVEGDA